MAKSPKYKKSFPLKRGIKQDKLSSAVDFIKEKPLKSVKELVIDKTQDLIDLDLGETTIKKTFGRPEDVIELHIYNLSNKILYSDYDFKDYTFPAGSDLTTSELIIDPEEVLKKSGFTSGKYSLKFNVHRNKIFNTDESEYPFYLKTISSTRTELRSISKTTSNNVFDNAINSFISELGSSAYFKEFALNFGEDVVIPAINVLLNKDPLVHELLIKTLDPLPNTIKKATEFKIVEEIVDSFFIEVDLGQLTIEDESIELMGPNFNVDIRQNMSIPSAFKTYDDLLTYNVSSSYDRLLNKLENKEIPNIQYDYIRTVSSSTEDTDIPYHFENFTHFSSAEERLNNFHYKLKLIELYNSQIVELETITGSTSSSIYTLSEKETKTTKIQNLVKGFDGYEQFLYTTTGSNALTWPKSDGGGSIFSISSSEAITWIGSNFSANHADGSGGSGQLLSASLYDRENPYNLHKLIPEHIKNNTDNTVYVGFINMVGQHFDYLWSHIKHITEINNHHNESGISQDLVYFQLKALGIESFDQFENANLIEYILGEGLKDHTVGTIEIGEYIVGQSNKFYNIGDNQTLVTASNEGSIPKGEITREIWKRLYHNAPYLLKTKGTERGIKALMSCYGIPSTILNIKEYGGSTTSSGPIKDIDYADYYKTFTYEKSGLALYGDSGTTTGYFIRTPWSSSETHKYYTSTQEEKGKSVEFRIKPVRSSDDYHLFSLSGSSGNGTVIDSAKDQHLILSPHLGSDISSSGDSKQFGNLKLYQGNTLKATTELIPIYNGDMWNINITANKKAGSTEAEIKFGAYQANFLKNVTQVTQSVETIQFTKTWGRLHKGAKYAYFGGVPSNTNGNYDTVDGLRYSGSLQGINIFFGEILSDPTFKKHALEPYMYAGNSVSSSYEHLVARIPLGANDFENSSSYHPNIDIDILTALEKSGVGYSTIGSNFTVGSYGVGSQVFSEMVDQKWEEVVEPHYLPTPDSVGASMTSEKVRIDEGTIPGNVLMHNKNLETSTLDRQPPDYEDLGIFFSPTEEINEDIIYTLGSFRMDDYIGSPLPSAQSADVYKDLADISDVYSKKLRRKYNYGDYIKLIQQVDHTLFKIIEQWVPFKANLKTGLLIEPTFLERNKFPRQIPVRSDGQTMTEGLHQHIDFTISSNYVDNKISDIDDTADPNTPQGQYEPGTYVVSNNNLSNVVSSKTNERLEKGTNATIEIYEDHMNPLNKDPNRENNQSCQAPIKPYSINSHSDVGVGSAQIGTSFVVDNYTSQIHPSNKPFGYKTHSSSTLLGMATKGRPSRRYYKYKEFNSI